MKLRTVAKFAVILSTLLFCVGVGVYSFVQLKLADKTQTVDLLELVPADSRGLLETDNVDFFISELPRMAYAAQFDTLHQSNLIETIFYELTQYTSHAAHGLSNQVNQLMLSFHFPGNPRDMVAYFRMSKEGKDLFKEVLREKYGDRFTPKKEIYRGKEIQVYPLDAEDFLSLYGGKGFLVASHEKRLIEQVIDAQLDKRSLSRDTVLASLRHNKSSRFMTLYGRTASVPLLTGKRDYCWSEFDLHMNSEVIYLNGSMAAPEACMPVMAERLGGIPQVAKDSLLILSGTARIDSCINRASVAQGDTLFNQCIANLSPSASYIMVADMQEVVRNKEFFKPYLPPFINEWAEMFDPFILSVQVTEVDGCFSHIFVLTYRE